MLCPHHVWWPCDARATRPAAAMGAVSSAIFIDPTDLGLPQLLSLLLVYAYILMTSSSMISDGSELLLLVPSMAGVVGSIVLPVLGAVPDGAIVLFSGLGDDAQAQLSVGIGALAGSTVMLLTVPWFLVRARAWSAAPCAHFVFVFVFVFARGARTLRRVPRRPPSRGA